jgi:hypothetical protein
MCKKNMDFNKHYKNNKQKQFLLHDKFNYLYKITMKNAKQ